MTRGCWLTSMTPSLTTCEHRDEVQGYLKRCEEEAKALRAKIEAERLHVSREELLARRSAREKDNAPTGQ